MLTSFFTRGLKKPVVYCEKADMPCKWTALLHGIATPCEVAVYRKSHLKTLWMMHWKNNLLGVILHQWEGWT